MNGHREYNRDCHEKMYLMMISTDDLIRLASLSNCIGNPGYSIKPVFSPSLTCCLSSQHDRIERNVMCIVTSNRRK